jgi:hypothetical protein
MSNIFTIFSTFRLSAKWTTTFMRGASGHHSSGPLGPVTSLSSSTKEEKKIIKIFYIIVLPAWNSGQPPEHKIPRSNARHGAVLLYELN